MTKTTGTKIDKKPDGTVSFDLVLKASEIKVEYQKVLSEVREKIEIQGFRKGKAPLALVESKSDKNELNSHVLEHLLSPAYSAVVHEHKLIPLIDPRVTPKEMGEGKDWIMAVEVATSPEIELGDYEKYVKKALAEHKKHDHKADKAEDAKKQEEEHKLNHIFDALIDNAKLEVSPLLIEEETKSALTRLASQLSSLKLTLEDYAKSIKKSTNDLVEEYKKSAEANLKLEFILQKLVSERKPEVTEPEIQALKPQKGQESYVKYVLQKRKVLDFLSGL